MKIRITFIILLFLSTNSPAQNDLWLYSPNVIIDFSSGEPEVRYDDNLKMDKSEASFTLSDDSGNVVFYTNSENIYNKEFQLMPGGKDVGGNYSSYQGILCTHDPSYPNIFHVFVSYKDLYHLIIDISVENGNGQVISNKKVWSGTTEHLTGFPNPCGGVWIVSHDRNENSNYFYSFLFDGINIKDPVISEAGTVNDDVYSTGGAIRISPDGRIIVFSNLQNMLEFHSFNDFTGEISFLKSYSQKTTVSGARKYYTGDFSNNSQFFYTLIKGDNPDSIYYKQLDLLDIHSGFITENIIGGIKKPSQINQYFIGSINKGPNGKIYMSHHPSNIIASIENPNLYGINCGFNPQRIVLEDLTGNFNFYRANTISPMVEYNTLSVSFVGLTDTTLCPTESLHLDYTTTPGTFLWSDGDTSRIKTFSQSGTYSLQVTTPEGCEYMDTFSLDVLPPDMISSDTLICDGGSVISNNQFYYVGDTYTDTVYTDDCPILNNISVKAIDPPFSTSLLPGDTSICEDSSLSLDLSHLPATFQWSDGSTDNFRLLNTAGNYALTITTEDGCIYTDSLLLSVISDEIISLDTILCPGESLVTSSHVYSSPGMYMDTSYQNDCPIITEIFLDIDSSALLSDTLFTTIPSGQSFTWYDQDYSDPGLYTYTYLNDNNCEVTDYLYLVIEESVAGQLYFPNIISANDDGINDRFFIRSEDQDLISVASFHIYNRWGSVVHRQEGNIPLTDISWNGKSGNDMLPTGVYTYLIRLEADENRKEEVITGTITLIR